MLLDIKLPHLGENIETGQVVRVLVNVGDRVEKNDSVLEVETDKASIEVPVEVAGIVKKIAVKEGDTIAVGEVVLSLDGADDQPRDDREKTPTQDHAKDTADDRSKTGTGKPSKTEVEETTGQNKGSNYNDSSGEKAQRIHPTVLVPASPSTRRFAREIGINISEVPGSGPAGRISIEDVKAYSKRLNRGVSLFPSSTVSGAKPLPAFEKWGDIQIEALSNIRAKTAERLSYAWSTIPHVTQFDKADITELEHQRQRLAYKAENAGTKLTITAIILKIITNALQKFPQFNASLDSLNNTIVYKKYYHLGVAVDTDRGLLVPVIRDVEKKGIIQICIELSTIANNARKKKTSIEDMQGGTFTLSNLGGIGGTFFTPVINWPEVAILGVARSSLEPVIRDGDVVPRRILPLALSYDHRVIDGADGARFLNSIVQTLENPLSLALDG